jgi:NAD(P)-dependent dehydrogenase (short-subunit alcohol dehydrogenase family)
MSNVAVITGAAQGIGRRTAQVLNDQGWSLLLLDLQTVDASEYTSALALAGDISDEQFVESAATQCMKKFGQVDALVNNAGISCISSALETSAELYRKVIDVNLVAPFLLAKAFGRLMLTDRDLLSTLRPLPDCKAWPTDPPTTQASTDSLVLHALLLSSGERKVFE